MVRNIGKKAFGLAALVINFYTVLVVLCIYVVETLKLGIIKSKVQHLLQISSFTM